ncbi:hypothetical protein K7X08_014830 [Anisodus acutangulus]|uniref:Uncharacterized protein n=1 Tax=Anisodus acutangulus TaxID=402998 RepID=A0A9Q1LKY9_9SOLA|nr:hypothetical protein K7X08_014830 [Anisodus acutangulus]
MAESASPPSSSVHIDLTRDEKEIFDLLIKVINHFNLATHLCVAGGWVRDKDDPLRVLLAIRFGARFGFMLDEELKNAAIDENVRTALVDKASKERIGHEIDLMISGEQANDPVQAVTYIADLNLFWDVFSVGH